MDADDFARHYETASGAIYLLAVRRTRDKREELTQETFAFLLHLAEAGPLTLTELARHVSRAQSTTSEMVEGLVGKGLLSRQPDPADARRAMVWLTDAGRQALADALDVLDVTRLAAAARRLDPDRRAALAELMDDLILALRSTGDTR